MQDRSVDRTRGGGHDQDGGGGGSSYFAHPQITNGSTTEGGIVEAGGAPGSVPNPGPVPQGGWPTTAGDANPGSIGVDGFQLLTGSQPATTTSTTIVSNSFTHPNLCKYWSVTLMMVLY